MVVGGGDDGVLVIDVKAAGPSARGEHIVFIISCAWCARTVRQRGVRG